MIGIGISPFLTIGGMVEQKTLINRNSDIVWSGGLNSIATNSGLSLYPMISKNNIATIRQSGQLNHIKIRVASLAAGAIYIQIWRKDGTTYDLVHKEDISTQLVVNTTVDVLLTNCNVKSGDYIGFRRVSGDGSFNIGYASGYASGSFKYKNQAMIVPEVNADLDTIYASELTEMLTIPSYSKAPLIVGCGDSLQAGHPGNYSGVEGSFVNVPNNSILGQLELLDSKYVYQNMGVGSVGTSYWLTKFTDYVLNLKPKMVHFHIGVNDLAGGLTKSTFLANMTTLLNAAQTAGIIPIVDGIAAWTSGTNAQMQARDDWNADLKTLVETYTGAIFVNIDSLGEFRTGGDVGNLWNIKSIYNSGDNIHLNLAGYAEIASLIDLEIKKKYRL